MTIKTTATEKVTTTPAIKTLLGIKIPHHTTVWTIVPHIQYLI